MKLADLIPDSNLLEQIEGVEAGLRKIQKIGRVGQYGFLFTAILQILFGLFESGVIAAPAPGSAAARALTGIKIASLVVLPLFLLLFTWSKFWLRQSREPFRYTCSIEAITPLPHSPTLRESAWLANDLEELLSQRIDRIRFVKSDAAAAAGLKDESHIDIGGTYVVRARDDEDKTLVLEIMPNVGIGRGKARKLAYPVSYPPDPTPLNRLRKKDDGEIELKHSEYKALLERVYSSVATEIYQQIQSDVAGKIELMPTKFLRALALFHEAEDYASSNTLHGYAEARRLYNASALLFDPRLKPLPVSPLRRSVARLTRELVSLARGALIRCAPVHLGFARREIMCVRALTGYVHMLLYERILATISGQKINPAYEAQRAAQDALARFDQLPPDAPGCREALFDAHVTLALAYYYLSKREEAKKELETARSKDPTRDLDIGYQMVRSVLAPREKQAFRNLLNLAPRWETAQWLVAYEAERQWRARPTFETSLADIPIREYQNVIDINPGNVGAWANCGYLLWLLGRCEEAKGNFRAGRDYKLIKEATFVAELDYGLARIAAEEGDLQQAYCYQETAISDLIAPTRSDLGDFRSYHFELAGDAVLDRFERYRADVEKHLADQGKTKDLSSRILNSVYAFVLTDYGECCQAHHLRTADSRSRDKAEQAYELANLFDPENPLALYNLRQLRVRDLPTPGQKTEADLEKEIAAAEAQIAELKKEQELAATHAQVAAAQNEKEKATAKARIEELEKDQATAIVPAQAHSPQQDARMRSKADLGGTQRGPADGRMDALQQEINSARESIRQSQEQINNARQQTIEAKLYDQRIRELHPYWTVGMLSEVEINALEAFIARRDAMREEKAAGDSKSPSALAAEDRRKRYIEDAVSLEKKVKQNIRALLPHDWLWTTDEDFNWNAIRNPDPLNERRWERQFNDIHTSALLTYAFTLLLSSSDNKKVLSLLDHIRQTFAWDDIRVVRRLRDLSKEGTRATHTEYDHKLRMITEGWRAQDPYSFASLWWVAENPFTDHEKMTIFLDASRRSDLSGSLYHWLSENQLLGIARRTKRKRELLEPVLKKMRQLSDAENIATRHLPEMAETRQSSNGTPDPQLIKALEVLDEIQSEEFEGNGIDNDEIKRLEKQVERILKDLEMTLHSVRAAKGFGTGADRKTWEETLPTRTLQLEKLVERYGDMERECGEGALSALTRAVTASNDPSSLWNIGAQLAKFGLLEPALEAAKKAAHIDAKRPEVALEREKLNEAVRTLSSAAPSDYSTKFKEFLKLYRQPSGRSRTPGKYLRRQCALLAMLDRCDTRSEPFLELKQSEKQWRAAIAAEIGELAGGDELESEENGPLVTGRAAFCKWLSQELRDHKADPAEVVDCRIAEITLARHERRDLQDGTPIIPGAKSFNFLPAVTPLAIEYETKLLGGDDSPSTKTLIRTLFPKMQDRIWEDTGVRIPSVRMRANDTDMPANQYLIMVNEIPLIMGTAYPDKVFVRGASSQWHTASWYRYGSRFVFSPEGEWRDPEKASDRRPGRTDVWTHLEYIARNLEHIARLFLVQFFGVQEARNTLGEWLETELPAEVAQHIRDIRDDQHLLRRTSRQLQGLLDERVPLTQPERVAAGLRASHSIDDAVECRRVLRDSVREQLWGNDGEYKHFKLSDSITAILDAKPSSAERFAISRADLYEFFSMLRSEFGNTGLNPAVVTRGERLRYLVRYLIREEWPEVPVLADYELAKSITYDELPVISLE